MRKRRTKAELLQLEQQIIDVLEEDHPQSVRHLFYRMTDPTLPESVPKTDKGKDNGYGVIQRLLSKMRKAGKIEYNWITDATRRGWYVDTFENAADFVRTMSGYYRADMWQRSPHYVEVWCESRSIAGVIEAVCKEYAVSLYPSGGFSSLTLAYESACGIYNGTNRGQKKAQIIYVGDYDPAGVLIDRNIEESIRGHLGERVDLNFHRIAINEEQITRHSLPTKPRKTSDKRSLHIQETVEAEAMPAHLMRSLLRETLDQFLPVGEMEVVKVAEENERAFLMQMANKLEGSSHFNVQGR